MVIGSEPHAVILPATDSRLDDPIEAVDHLVCCRRPWDAGGTTLCGAEIGAFNGIPASSMTVFLTGGSLRAVKLSYRRAYHHRMREWVEGRVGAAGDRGGEGSAFQIEDGVAVWAVADGLLAMRDGVLTREDDPALLWLSQAALARRGGARASSQIPFN